MNFLIGCLFVFGITLIVTKSKIMACKRQFVKERYLASFVGNQKPAFIHTVWHAWWTCPMCLGFWVSALVAPWFHVTGYIFDTLALFSANWLLHCLEAVMFEGGKFFEKFLDESEDSGINDV